MMRNMNLFLFLVESRNVIEISNIQANKQKKVFYLGFKRDVSSI